jgi:hypothetical protein
MYAVEKSNSTIKAHRNFFQNTQTNSRNEDGQEINYSLMKVQKIANVFSECFEVEETYKVLLQFLIKHFCFYRTPNDKGKCIPS